jgi:hypothetical protein
MKSNKMIVGRLPIEKLQALANLKAVRYIAPVDVEPVRNMRMGGLRGRPVSVARYLVAT